jgi:hypothetical protein
MCDDKVIYTSICFNKIILSYIIGDKYTSREQEKRKAVSMRGTETNRLNDTKNGSGESWWVVPIDRVSSPVELDDRSRLDAFYCHLMTYSVSLTYPT